MKTNVPHVPVKLSRDGRGYRIFDREFRVEDYGSRQLARKAAEEFGTQHLSTLETQAARPLSTREQIFGVATLPQEKAPVRSMRAEQATPAANMYDPILADLRARSPRLPQDKARLKTRIEHYEKLREQKQAELDAQAAEVVRENHPDVIRQREWAAKLVESATLNPELNPHEVEAARELQRLSETATPGEFWAAVRAAGGEQPPVEKPAPAPAPVNVVQLTQSDFDSQRAATKAIDDARKAKERKQHA